MDLDDATTPAAVSRRSLLVKGGAATALVWSAPAVLSVSAAHAGVGSPRPTTGGGPGNGTGTGDPTPPPAPVLTPKSAALSSLAAAGLPDALVKVGGVPAVGVSTTQRNVRGYQAIGSTTFVEAPPALGLSPDTTDFTVSFELPATGAFAEPSLTFAAQGDGRVSAVLLNGTAVGTTQAAPSGLSSNVNGSQPATGTVTDPTRFQPGTNTLTISVTPLTGVNTPAASLNLSASATWKA